MERSAKKNFLIDFSYAVLVGIIVFAVCRFLLKYLLPFIFAVIVAFFMQKPSNYISKKTKIRQGTTAAILSVIVYFSVAIICSFLIYRLVLLAAGFTEYLPQLFEKVNVLLAKAQNFFYNSFGVANDKFNAALTAFFGSALEKFTFAISGFVSEIVKNMPSFFISSIVALVATCYIAKDFNGLVKFLKLFFGKKITKKTIRIKNILFESVFKFVKGYSILTLITYFELLAGLLILRVKFAPVLALLIAFVDLLPIIGTGTVMIPWAFFSAINGRILFAISLAVLYIMIIVIRNFAEPKIIGTQIGINPLFTLLAMFTGLKVLGLAGLILFPIILIVVIRYYKDEMEEGLSV